MPDADDAGDHGSAEEVAPSSTGTENGPSLNAVLRVMAETQRKMLLLHAQNERDGGPKRNRLLLSQVKLPEFNGSVSTTTRQYREWRKAVSIIKQLNSFTDKELTLIVFSQVTGRAKELIEILEPEDLDRDDALEIIRNIYDDAFEKMDHERLDEVHIRWEKAHRRIGQPIMDWISYVRKLRLELQVQDPSSSISDRGLAS